FCLGAWDEKKKIILVHLLQLLNELDFTIVAEGIETKEIADFFAQHSCHILQGFYFSKPLPIPFFERFLLENNPVKS
ncbi:MAG: EAL domain-containing protein, partial [Longicatena sp.]